MAQLPTSRMPRGVKIKTKGTCLHCAELNCAVRAICVDDETSDTPRPEVLAILQVNRPKGETEQ
jgi:hypothetical protein